MFCSGDSQPRQDIGIRFPALRKLFINKQSSNILFELRAAARAGSSNRGASTLLAHDFAGGPACRTSEEDCLQSPSVASEPYSVEQMQYIVAHMADVKEPLDRAFLALLSLHPLRLEEVLGLKQEDIDRERFVLHIQRAVTHPTRNMPEIKATKTEASRRDIELVREIVRYLPTGPAGDFLLGGKAPLSYTQVRRMCRRIERDIAFSEKITPIRFRTTVLTDIYDETKDIKKAQAAAGHTTSAMTLKHYVHGRQPQGSTANPISRRYGLAKEATA